MSLAGGDLTTYANALAYVAAFSGQSLPSPLLQGLVTRISRMIQTKINRSFLLPKSYSQSFNGSGTTTLVLPDWPIIGSTLTGLTIGGASVSLAPQPSNPNTVSIPYGYRFQQWNGVPPGNPAVVELVGGAFFCGGNQNIVVNYNAGYEVSGELVPPAGPTTYTPLAPYGIWATDEGVEYVGTGTALTAIPSGIPSVGQYVPPAPDANPVVSNYIFNATDVSAGLSVSYGFIPGDLEQVCLELVAERASYRSRVGVRSQNLAGQESISYDLDGLPAYARSMLQPYVSVIPPAIGASV